jgi:hypothetical protein
MTNDDQINLRRDSGSKDPLATALNDRQLVHELLQGLLRVESKLDRIESRLAGGSGVTRKVADKPNLRNMLTALLLKGWVSEPEVIEKTGWQTIGVRSFVTKLRGLGLSVETEERDGVPHYRIAK